MENASAGLKMALNAKLPFDFAPYVRGVGV